MKKIAYFQTICLLSLFVLQGCYKDEGNYDYETINEITIDLGFEGFLDQYAADTVHIDPVLTFSSGEPENDLSYYWYCNNEEIATEKVLNYPVKQLKGKRPYVKFKVINNRDSSTFISGFYVEIIPDYMTGWVVLTKEGERSILSYINPVDYSIYPDFYTEKTGLELGPDVLRIKEHWPFDATTIGSILVIRNTTEGNLEIDGENLNPFYNTNDFFLGGQTPEDYRPLDEYYMWDYSFILDDNHNLYRRKHENNKLFQSGVYSNVPMYISGGVKFEKAWSGPFFSSLTLFYDKDNGALYVGSDYGSVLAVSFTNIFPGMPGDYTFIDNMDKELVYVGNMKQGRFTSPFYLVYKDDAGTYYVQKIQVVHQAITCMVIHQGEASFGDGKITDNTVFCQLERKSDYLFFSGGENEKTLYLYEHATAKLNEYYTFDSPIKTICHDLSNSTNNTLMVGLENGDLVFLGISLNDMMDPGIRFKQKVELGEGVPVSTFYKCGYNYSQY